MSSTSWKWLRPLRRHLSDSYILSLLVAFATTVIVTRLFLELTGYPQLGNSVLHIAHALWGGLLLIVGATLPLALANRWALRVSAVLSGMGTGLFIDEVGKFITQTNDYFFPPALSLIYGFFLLCAFLFVTFRLTRRRDPQQAMIHALEGLQDSVNGELDFGDANRIQAELALAGDSDSKEIRALAAVLADFLTKEEIRTGPAKPSPWKQLATKIDALGQRPGRRVNRGVVAGILILWLTITVGYIFILIQGGSNLDVQVLQFREVLIGIQGVIGLLMLAAAVSWLIGKEEPGLTLGMAGFLFSLVALQLLYFYISQFSALTATLIQFLFLQILLAYRRWYLVA